MTECKYPIGFLGGQDTKRIACSAGSSKMQEPRIGMLLNFGRTAVLRSPMRKRELLHSVNTGKSLAEEFYSKIRSPDAS